MISIKVIHKDKTQDIWQDGDVTKANTFLVIGPGFYGYGESLAVAKKNCLKAGCKASNPMKAYLGDQSLGVTMMGEVKADKFLFNLGSI